MQTNRQDALDPKLQDSYRLKAALNLIEDQDLIISKQATDIQHYKNVINQMSETSRKAHDLFQEAQGILTTNSRGYRLW